MKINVEYELPETRIADLLCNVVEGQGAKYWLDIVKEVEPEEWTYNDGDTTKRYLHTYPLNKGGALILRDMEGDSSKKYRLDLPMIQKGLEVMARQEPEQFSYILDENDDEVTADIFIQCCLFGEVLYS